MLIGKIDARTRQKILVTIRVIKGTKTADMTVHETSEEAEFVPTPAGVSLLPDEIEHAKKRLSEQK